MPGKNNIFTALVEAIRPRRNSPYMLKKPLRTLVEAPGTAPGSNMPILYCVYHHSWLPSPNIIGISKGFVKVYLKKIIRGQDI